MVAGDGSLNWTKSIPLKTWQGVEVGGFPRRIVRLNLRSRELTGVVPTGLGMLDGLQDLDLSHNRLTGTIPPELGNLEKVRFLRLHINRLSGNIPAEFGSLMNLVTLDLGKNQLTGEVPPELGGLPSLRRLYFAFNFLTGEVPVELIGLSTLETLHILDNRLSGCVPDGLRDIDTELGTMRFCGDPLPVRSDRPTFDGGVDLGVTYIERLPRFQRYQLAYLSHGDCPYPFDEFKGAIVCPGQAGIKRWPKPGETVELIAHVWNFGDTVSGPFEFEWKKDNRSLKTDHHEGLASGEHTEFVLTLAWSDDAANPVVTFAVDTQDEISEIIEDNNAVVDWIKGYTLGFFFSPGAYESLRLSNEPGRQIQSAERWVHNNIVQLNALLAEAGLKERVRVELLVITDEENLHLVHDLQWYMDGWWGIWDHDNSHYTLQNYSRRSGIDWGLLHELMHQLGLIDLYNMHLTTDEVLLPDVNRPLHRAGCGTPYWHDENVCFRFPRIIGDIMATLNVQFIGPHTAGGLRTNTGYRRGFFGEYLYDTPEQTRLRIVDRDGATLPDTTLRLYQLEPREHGHVLDAVPEIVVTTDRSGLAVLPNLGITGIVTATGHQLRPNPFGVIDVLGTNGIFLIEMEGPCTNYEWLTIVELNLAYWNGHTDEAVFTKTLHCPPKRQSATEPVSPERPKCIPLKSPHPSERLLTITGEDFGSFGNSHLQFRILWHGESIHFGSQVEWVNSTLIRIDIGSIVGLFEKKEDRLFVFVRLTNAFYEPISDWSEAFLVATNADEC